MTNGASVLINKNTELIPALICSEIDSIFRARLEDLKI